MKTLILNRDYQKKYTTGVLKYEDLTLYTLERPWKNNETDKSCIPEGSYKLKRIIRPNGSFAFELINVPGRTHVLIHIGNYLWETKGCILPGTSRSAKQVWHSRDAMIMLDKIIRDSNVQIIIDRQRLSVL